ncbi:MAG: 1-aminocyclopropane-1-carboxylate deaminase [Ghiorsea sp.]
MLSEVSPFHFRGYDFFVKRDELIDPLLSGNKYRKLYGLLQTPSETYETMVSYGGTQSNAMLSIAALCQQKGWAFDYYSRPVADHLKQQVSGNLKEALALCMQLHEVPHETYESTINQLQIQSEDKRLLIPQGGADPLAQEGIDVLAEEIKQWCDESDIKQLNVVTPSGTGTTAYYLSTALPEHNVFTTPSVGSSEYLKQQMQRLGNIPNNLNILEPGKTYHFAKPYPEFLSIYHELKDAGITFDLIYGAKMWLVLMQHMQNIQGTVLYVHSGGLIGNPSMLERYKHKGLHI